MALFSESTMTTASFLISTGALLLTWAESRRNSRPIIRIVECTYSGTRSADENGGSRFDEFHVVIRNHGIALHDVSVNLRFRAKGGGGVFHVPLNRLDDPGFIHAEFARGMTGSFGLKSYQLDAGQTNIILALEDPKTQRATLVIGAGGFCVGEIPATGWRDQLAGAWNRVGAELYSKSSRNVGIGTGGIPIARSLINLTCRPNYNIQLANFLGALRHRSAQPSRVPPHG